MPHAHDQIGGLFTGNVNVIGLIAGNSGNRIHYLYMLFKPYKESNTLKASVSVK